MIKVMRKYNLLGVGPREVVKRISRMVVLEVSADVEVFATEDRNTIFKIADKAHTAIQLGV